MNLEKERELFEAWCTRDDNYCIHRYAGDDKYSEWDTQAAWDAWLASASREGYKLAPIKATDSQWAAGIDAYTQAMDGQDILSASAFFDIYEAMMGAIE